MISLRKIEHISELKMGMTILTADSYGQSLLKIACIDNGLVHTENFYTGESEMEEDLDTFLEDYEAVCEVTSEYNPEPYQKSEEEDTVSTTTLVEYKPKTEFGNQIEQAMIRAYKAIDITLHTNLFDSNDVVTTGLQAQLNTVNFEKTKEDPDQVHINWLKHRGMILNPGCTLQHYGLIIQNIGETRFYVGAVPE